MYRDGYIDSLCGFKSSVTDRDPNFNTYKYTPAHKHATPTRVGVWAGRLDGAFISEVVNDGIDLGKYRAVVASEGARPGVHHDAPS